MKCQKNDPKSLSQRSNMVNVILHNPSNPKKKSQKVFKKVKKKEIKSSKEMIRTIQT